MPADDLPSPPSPEQVALGFVLAKALPRIMSTGPDGVREWDIPELARRLHDAGWRRESDVYRTAAGHLEAWTRSPAVVGTLFAAWLSDDNPDFRRGIEHAAATLGQVADMCERRDGPGKPTSREELLARLGLPAGGSDDA